MSELCGAKRKSNWNGITTCAAYAKHACYKCKRAFCYHHIGIGKHFCQHPNYTLADQAAGRCPVCLASVEVECGHE